MRRKIGTFRQPDQRLTSGPVVQQKPIHVPVFYSPGWTLLVGPSQPIIITNALVIFSDENLSPRADERDKIQLTYGKQNEESLMVYTLSANSPVAAAPAPLAWPPLRLYVRHVGQQYFSVASLMYIQSEANYSWLYWADGQRMLMPRTLKWYMDQLPPAHFIRFHRNCIVNRHYIQHLENSKAGPVAQLTTGETLVISRRRWTEVRRELQLHRLLPT